MTDEDVVRICVLKLRLSNEADREDAAQEARLALVKAHRSWDPARGEWESHALVCVQHHLWKWDRRRQQQGMNCRGRGPRPKRPAVGRMERDEPVSGPCAAETLETITLVRTILDNLPEPAQSVLRGIIAGESQATIAARFGRNQSWVSRQLLKHACHFAAAV